MNDIDALKEQLNKDNKEYYDEVYRYIKAGGRFFKSKKHTQDTLLELLNDLLEAQSQGLSAEDYFGKNPEIMCDEILNNLEKESFFNKSGMMTSLFLVILGLNGFTKLVYPEDLFDVGKITIRVIIQTLMVYFVIRISKYYIFDKNKSYRNSFICLMLLSLIDGRVESFPDILMIDLSGISGIIFIGLSTLAITVIILYKYKENRNLLCAILIPATIAVLNRFEATSHFFETKIGQYIIDYHLIVCFILLILNFRDKSKSKKVS